MQSCKCRSSQGFSLIEIVVVLTIIGLIVGGVLYGRNLMRESELRSVLADIDKISSASLTFKDKYGSLPGDFPKAESVWGSDSSCPSTATNTTQKVETCNGTGDGRISPVTGTDYYEVYRAPQQLANAGLIEGSYTGVAGSLGAYAPVIGVNVPESRIKAAGYVLRYIGSYTASTWYSSDYGHMIQFGRVSPTVNTYARYPVLSPADAWSMDIKRDDGLPAYGNIMTYKSSASFAAGCSTTDVESTAAYALTDTDIKCGLIFKTGF